MDNVFDNFKSLVKQILAELSTIKIKIKGLTEKTIESQSIENCISYLNIINSTSYYSPEEILDAIKNVSSACKSAINASVEISYRSDDPKILDNEIFLLKSLNTRINSLLLENSALLELEKEYLESTNNKSTDENSIISKNEFFEKTSNDIKIIKDNIFKAQSKILELNKKIEENNQTIQLVNNEIPEALQNIQRTYNTSIEFIEKSNDKIYELLSIASNSIINGSYKENSLRELKSADRLRAIAIILMLGIIIFTLFSLFDLQNNKIEINNFLLRILSGILFSIPAIYLTRESSKHRQNHLTYLQKSLDLAAFEPFISGIDGDKQNLLKSEMVKEIFFKTSIKDDRDSYPVDINGMLKELISKIEIKNK